MAALEATALTKTYGDVTAVDGLDLQVEDDEVFGFLGPNGAGKTTAIDVLLGLRRSTSGSAEVLGEPAGDHDVLRRVGVVPEDYGVYERLTAVEHVEFAAESKDVEVDAEATLERVGLADDATRRAGELSKGNRKRLMLATALVGEPDLLVLDEPTSGLDPNGAKLLREIVVEERDRGAAVFFSSHVLSQVEKVSDRVGIMEDGDLVAVDSVDELRRRRGGVSVLHVQHSGEDSAPPGLREVDGVVDVEAGSGRISVTCESGAVKLEALDMLRDHVDVEDFAVEDTSLEQLFGDYTGEGG